jgi:hypothetical protein
LHHATGFFGIIIMQHVDQNSRHDLPRQPKFVLEPPAGRLLAAVSSELLSKIIDLLLDFAVHNERNGFVEFEKWPAIKRDKFLTFDFEFDCQHRPDGTTDLFSCFFGVAENSSDLRVFEDRGVKLHGILGLIIEPQEWSNFLHREFLLKMFACLCPLSRFDPNSHPAEFGVSQKSHRIKRC